MLIHEPGTRYQCNVRPYKVPCLWKLLCINRTSAGSTLVYSLLKRFSLVAEVNKSKDLHVDILANTIHTCNIHIFLKITRSTYLCFFMWPQAQTQTGTQAFSYAQTTLHTFKNTAHITEITLWCTKQYVHNYPNSVCVCAGVRACVRACVCVIEKVSAPTNAFLSRSHTQTHSK